jgi:acyl-coenzyme A thioesterase PaaI-like protein
MELKTHLKIDRELNGEIIELKENYAKVKLTTNSKMVADEYGLIHGGFIFASADFAAMSAVNDEFVVLAKSETKFTAPVKIDDIVVVEANVISSDGFKSEVEVEAKVKESLVFKGKFYTASLKRHVLS